jgi:hypothetical protein
MADRQRAAVRSGGQEYLRDSGIDVLGLNGELKVRYSIDKHQRLIVTTAEGCVTFDDARGHQDRLLVDPDFDPSFDQLIDTTHVTNIDISADEVRILASRRILSSESRRAFVATRPHIFGLGRMMEIFHEDLGYADVHVFYSINEALEWLKSGERKH